MSPQADRSPAFQFYARDFLSDVRVMAMSLEEVGAYWKLVSICWLEEGLPSELPVLARLLHVTPAKFAKLWPAIEPCFRLVSGTYQHPRLDREREKQDEYRRKQSEKGRKSAEARSNHGSTTVQPEGNRTPTGTQPEGNSSSSSSSASASSTVKTFRRSASSSVVAPGFLEFWLAYPKHRNRADAEKAWNALSPDAELQRQILAALAWQVTSPDWLKDNGQFVPLPASWLRARRWEDEPPKTAKLAGVLSDVGMQSLVGLSAFRERMAVKAAGGEQ